MNERFCDIDTFIKKELSHRESREMGEKMIKMGYQISTNIVKIVVVNQLEVNRINSNCKN